jgi:[NiFe] hydrogenase diaphorase moiety small subunit
MGTEKFTITVDGVEIEATEGQTVMEACDEAGIYIPRLCAHDDLKPAGHCRMCTCKINKRFTSACTMPVARDMVVENDTPELNADRRTVLEMLFVEGNHFCPACEKSGSCELQALGYRLGMITPQLPYQWPDREVVATHPDIFIDYNRCILCGRCARASKAVDGKCVFAFEERGIHQHIAIGEKNRLDETALAAADKAAHVCPVGAIVIKRTAYRTPQGQRPYDHTPIGADIEARRATPKG